MYRQHSKMLDDRSKDQVNVSAANQKRGKIKEHSQPGGWVCAVFGPRTAPGLERAGMEAREKRCAARDRGVGRRALAAEARSEHAELSKCSVLARSPYEALGKSALEDAVRTREISCLKAHLPQQRAAPASSPFARKRAPRPRARTMVDHRHQLANGAGRL
jgi:hypothetical protein